MKMSSWNYAAAYALDIESKTTAFSCHQQHYHESICIEDDTMIPDLARDALNEMKMNKALTTVLRDYFKKLNIQSCNTVVGALFIGKP
jgi:hypothetical protein